MKKTFNFVFAIGILAIVSACTEMTPEPEQAQSPAIKDMVFTLSLDNKDSKVSIADNGKSTWDIGDAIYIHGEYMNRDGYCQTVVLDGTVNTISPDGKTATIHIATNDGATENLLPETVYPYYRSTDYKTTLYAIYPASAAATRDFHCYYYTEFKPSNQPIMVGCDDGNGAFEFKNLSGVISFQVSGSVNVDEYIFMGNNDETVAYDTYGMLYIMKSDGTIRHEGPDGSIVSTSGAAKTVRGTVTNDGTTLNRICIPGGADFTGGFTILFKKSGSVVKMISTDSHINVPMNGYLPLGNISTNIKDYTPPSSHPATSPTLAGATEIDDSSLDKHANCYVVDGSDAGNCSKTFYFKAYQGNSTTGVGAVNSVEVLWETYNDDTSPVSAGSVVAAVDFDKQSANDYYDIVFQMPAALHAGNAVIAAKDVNGDILWSWHIWVPSTTLAGTDVDASNICGATIMDRNLGALEPVSTSTGASVYSMGLIYQWGRKDPFPGPKRVQTWPNPATVSKNATTLNDASMTWDEARKNPTVYGNVSGSDWQTSTDMTRWKSDKTINDPCPIGYKVPYGSRGSKPMWNTTDISTALTDASLGWEISTTGYWFKMSDGAKEVVFPLSGYVDDGVSDHYYLGNVTTRAGVWCLSDSSSSKYHLNIRTDGTYVFGSTSAARGCAVRCVAE